MTLRDQQPPQEDPTDLAHRLAALLEQYPEERQGSTESPAGHSLRRRKQCSLRTAQKLGDIPAEYPAPILRATGRNGAVLSEGQICLLAAEGGIGKSPFTTAIAVSIAMLPEENGRPPAPPRQNPGGSHRHGAAGDLRGPARGYRGPRTAAGKGD